MVSTIPPNIIMKLRHSPYMYNLKINLQLEKLLKDLALVVTHLFPLLIVFPD